MTEPAPDESRRALLARMAVVTGGIWVAPQVLAQEARADAGLFSVEIDIANGCVQVSPPSNALTGGCDPAGWNVNKTATLALLGIVTGGCNPGNPLNGGPAPAFTATVSGLCTIHAGLVEGSHVVNGAQCYVPNSQSATSISFAGTDKDEFISARLVVSCIS